ncbi:superoxide dismutase family protein [uncultured Nitrospira sp.]|uniref:superoxide dismutase family protein n=1 Tax=uncultured Nitrospira sp. TaxID=157176 RepID=UPI0031408207
MQKNHFRICQMTGFAALMVAVLSGCSHYGSHNISKTANATIQGCTDPAISGTATLKEFESEEGIKKLYVQMEVDGLKDGKHAVHIHEVASCQPCGAAKGHHDPGPFGKSTPDAPDFNHPFHMGDLVNMTVVNGVGKLNAVTTRVALSDGRLSVFDDDGSAFIIHTNEDLYCDQDSELNPGCAGGARDACGIIEPVSSM